MDGGLNKKGFLDNSVKHCEACHDEYTSGVCECRKLWKIYMFCTKQGFTGKTTLNWHKGNLSKKYEISKTEDLV